MKTKTKTASGLSWHGLPARETARCSAVSSSTGDSSVFRMGKPQRNSNTWASRPCHAIRPIRKPTGWQPVPLQTGGAAHCLTGESPVPLNPQARFLI